MPVQSTTSGAGGLNAKGQPRRSGLAGVPAREYSEAFLDFDALRGALEVISISQFLNETIQDVKTRTHLKSLAERATNGGVIARRQLREWMRTHSDIEPRWAPLKECVAFGPCWLRRRRRGEHSVLQAASPNGRHDLKAARFL